MAHLPTEALRIASPLQIATEKASIESPTAIKNSVKKSIVSPLG
jgi:hypothetical protein